MNGMVSLCSTLRTRDLVLFVNYPSLIHTHIKLCVIKLCFFSFSERQNEEALPWKLQNEHVTTDEFSHLSKMAVIGGSKDFRYIRHVRVYNLASCKSKPLTDKYKANAYLGATMARFYGQNIEMYYINVRKYIHPYYVAYIDVKCNKRCSVQRECKRCPIKLKDVQ